MSGYQGGLVAAWSRRPEAGRTPRGFVELARATFDFKERKHGGRDGCHNRIGWVALHSGRSEVRIRCRRCKTWWPDKPLPAHPLNGTPFSPTREVRCQRTSETARANHGGLALAEVLLTAPGEAVLIECPQHPDCVAFIECTDVSYAEYVGY